MPFSIYHPWLIQGKIVQLLYWINRRKNRKTDQACSNGSRTSRSDRSSWAGCAACVRQAFLCQQPAQGFSDHRLVETVAKLDFPGDFIRDELCAAVILNLFGADLFSRSERPPGFYSFDLWHGWAGRAHIIDLPG